MELSVERISGGYYQASEENSPSPDYPSEIETVKNNVEIDVVNKNLFPSVKSQSVESNGIALSYNADTQEFHAEGNTTSTNFYCNMSCGEMNFLKANKNYIFSVNNSMVEKCLFQITRANVGNNGDIQAGEKSVTIVNLDKYIPNSVMFYSSNIEIGTKISYTFKVQIEEGTTATDIVEHQSQSAIMPIQQEMLEGDYISSVEHHEWRNLVLTGTEALVLKDIYQGIAQFEIEIKNSENKAEWANDDKIRAFSNYYRGVIYNNSWFIDNCITTIWNGQPRIMTSQFTDVKSFKAGLKSKYDAGTPVTIYYKLATPVDLELTEEQKAVRENKLYTYKNITNINSSDELASIDVEYKKDLETMFNNIIKQIPSSASDKTET